MQMSQPSISVLSEPFGMHSPMALLWNFIGLNPWYESVCGAAELLAGLMILFRRTALAGALFTAFVVSNVLLYNLFFDVPVKLYSGHLLLLSLFVILPDARALFRFFWQHQPAAPTGVWVPPATRPWFRRATIAIEIVFVMSVIGNNLFGLIPSWLERRAEAAAKCDLCSAWRVESQPVAPATHLPSPFSGDVSELVVNSPTGAVLRDPTYRASYVRIEINGTARTLEMYQPSSNKILFSFTQPDSMHLILTPMGDKAGKAQTVEFVRTTPIGGYPLLHRGFHWVDEYPYQR
jgi:hypothetical protein